MFTVIFILIFLLQHGNTVSNIKFQLFNKQQIVVQVANVWHYEWAGEDILTYIFAIIFYVYFLMKTMSNLRSWYEFFFNFQGVIIIKSKI